MVVPNDIEIRVCEHMFEGNDMFSTKTETPPKGNILYSVSIALFAGREENIGDATDVYIQDGFLTVHYPGGDYEAWNTQDVASYAVGAYEDR